MSLLQRAATLAAVTLALAGFAGLGTPGQAAALQASQLVGTQPAPAALGEPVPAAFETLDAAIAAQGEPGADAGADPAAADATRCLAAAIYFEAKGEPAEGQLAVAEVIINRAKSGRFPDDVCGVVTQRGQFSFVHAGAIPDIADARPAYRTAVAVARVAMAAAWHSGAPAALYFHARHEPMGGRMTRIAAIGNHVFYR